MQGKKQVTKRKEDTSALIHQEWQLVLSGKPADKLVEYIYDYEMDILTNLLETNPSFIQKYSFGLLIVGDYLELSHFLARTKQVHSPLIKIAQKAKLIKIANAGKAEQLKQLGKTVEEYLGEIKDGRLKVRVKESTLNAILRVLTKYFINYKYADLKILFNVTEDEVRQLGFNIQGGFIELNKEEARSDCLMTKLRELAIVADKMNKFE